MVSDIATEDEARLDGLLGHYEARLRGRAMPSWRDFDVVELAPWLGNLSLIEVLEGGGEFQYRVMGTNIVNEIGFDMTGKRLSGIVTDWRDRFADELRGVVEGRRPYRLTRSDHDRHRKHVVLRQLFLPLSSDGLVVDRLLVAGYFAR